jgi:hypothetical protein
VVVVKIGKQPAGGGVDLGLCGGDGIRVTVGPAA